MEDSHSIPGDYKARVDYIAASGHKAEDWKEYIDTIKSNSVSWGEQRRNRILAFMYRKAFKAMPETNKSLAYAQLLVDYSEFKSEHDLNDAAKLLTYGRKLLPYFANVQVASAKIELKRGNKNLALHILQKALSLGAEPSALLTSVLQQLTDSKQGSPEGGFCQNGQGQMMISPESGKDSSRELSNTNFTGTFSDLWQALPGQRSSTQEVQHDLDILASSSNTEQKQMQSQKPYESPPHSTSHNAFNHLRTPEPPVLLLDYSNLSRDNFSYKCKPVVTSSNPLNSIPETPQGQHLVAGKNDFSTGKRTLLSFDNTPDTRKFLGSALKSSVNKPRVANLGPPQRVKVNPELKKLQNDDDEEDEEFHVQETSESTFEHLHTYAASTKRGYSVETKNCIPEQTQDEANSRTLKDILNTRFATDAGSLSVSTIDMMSLSSSATKINRTYSVPTLGQNEHKNSDLIHNLPWEQSKDIEDKDRDIKSQFKMEPPANVATSRKLMVPTSHVSSHVPTENAPFVLPSNNRKLVPEYGIASCPLNVGQYIKAETTQEIIAKQQELIQQLLQQQLQQQSHAGVNKAFSIPDQQVMMANNIMAVKAQIPSAQKTMFVNGKPYVVLKKIGQGGSAKVFEVSDPENCRRALKSVNLANASQVIVEGYKNEINLLKKLQHCDRVIKLYDSEYIEGSKKLLAVLELGETDLCKCIFQNGNNKQGLNLIVVRFYWREMVIAVNAMHKEGVIHSDLKPANFILVSGAVKLIDFGIANSLQQDNTSVLKENMVGTPSYMSPEALMAINSNTSDSKPRYKVGVRSDVWSLGCILYQMVYGYTPFQNIRHKLEAIVNPAHEIPFPDRGDPVLMDVLKKCLSRNIQQRPTTDELLKHPYLN